MKLLADFGIAGQILGDGGSALANIGKVLTPLADDVAAPLINSKKKKTYTMNPLQPRPAQTAPSLGINKQIQPPSNPTVANPLASTSYTNA